ncbi:glutathione S-transferase [Caenimonas koreensis DSM 17982]|uniref:Glutathione S-transferase n=1 Tax=Caenimonas koreensis DSM 17982 TaxID=1121255 RepID=A0A844B8C2_9BURK|nr:glutathione S-transferase [Caenimonas koreensis]MRD49403.1 glutathione S-transferase [Caenimonas koreensis DSM 17982]
MLKIWGRLSSINVRKVVLAAQWLGIPFERVDAGGQYGIVTTDAYRAINPNSLVPLIDDDGFTLYESNVIVRYLCAKHSAGGLYPATLQARFDAERWMDWQQTTLNPAGRTAFVQLIRVAPDKRDATAIAQSVAATEPLLDMLEATLSKQPHISGEQFTMADIPIACEIHRWQGLPLEHKTRPALAQWYHQILDRHAARGVLDLPLS